MIPWHLVATPGGYQIERVVDGVRETIGGFGSHDEMQATADRVNRLERAIDLVTSQVRIVRHEDPFGEWKELEWRTPPDCDAAEDLIYYVLTALTEDTP